MLPQVFMWLQDSTTQHASLRILGKLTSDASDRNAHVTRALIRERGGFEELLAFIWSRDLDILSLALGTVQHLVSTEWCEHLAFRSRVRCWRSYGQGTWTYCPSL